jgi:small neutral amino acid transporter SnatA (MarC family)
MTTLNKSNGYTMSVELFLSAFVSLFVVTDPFGTAAVFAALTRNMSHEEQRKIALKAVLIAGALLIGFSIVGQWILEHMKVSLEAFRVAGGLLLFVTAIVQVISFGALNGAGYLNRVVGPTGNGIAARIMGILLAAMAVQFIADALKELLPLS